MKYGFAFGGKAVSLLLVVLMAAQALPLEIADAQAPSNAGKEIISLETGWEIQSSEAVGESGASLSSASFESSNWHPATIPSTVLSALVADGVYPDPYFGMNLAEIPREQFECAWWYRTEFQLPETFEGKRVSLRFNGISHSANLWMNGVLVADSTEMVGTYRSFEFDITKYAVFGASNALALEIFPPKTIDLEINWFDWNPWPTDLDMGIWQSVLIEATGMVELENPHVVTDLPLPELAPARITISSDVINHLGISQEGTLRATISPKGNPDNKVIVEKKVGLDAMETKTITMSPDEFPNLIFKEPLLWWPNNVGPQNLYDLNIEFILGESASDTEEMRFGIREVTSYLTDASSTVDVEKLNADISRDVSYVTTHILPVIKDGKLCLKIPSHGLATAEIIKSALSGVSEANSQDGGRRENRLSAGDTYIGPIWIDDNNNNVYCEIDGGYYSPLYLLGYTDAEIIASQVAVQAANYYIDKSEGNRIFEVNGKTILLRGGAWTDEILMRVIPERYDAQVAYFKDLNFNVIRLENDVCADLEYLCNLCDEAGILVFLGWHCGWEWGTSYNWDRECLTDSLNKYRGNIEKAPNNADLAVSYTKDAVLRYRNHPSFSCWIIGSDRNVPYQVETGEINLFNTYDGTRPLVAYACGKGDITRPAGDPGWRMGGPYWNFERPEYYYTDPSLGAYGFTTEGGPSFNIPPVESMKKMLPEESWWPIDEYWDYHCALHQMDTPGLTNMTDRITSSYGAPESIDDYCMKAQLLQYETNLGMFEAWGRNKYASTGLIQWKANGAWPSLQWQVFDYYLMPGGSYFATKKACEPLHIQYSYDDDSIYIVNSYYEAFEGLTATAKIFDFSTELKYENTISASVGPDGKTNLFMLPKIDGLSKIFFLELKLNDASGKEISSNFYWLTSDKSYDFEGLKELPACQIKESHKMTKDGSTYTVEVTINNPESDKLAFFITPKIAKDGSGELVLPITWTDNYFSLPPGESRTVTAHFDEKYLGGESPILKIDGYNLGGEQTSSALSVSGKFIPGFEIFGLVAGLAIALLLVTKKRK